MLPDLAGLVAALHNGEVAFVVIGGVAVAAHARIRATEDLDIVPDPSRENLDRLGNALALLDARLSSDPGRGIDPELREALYRGRNLTVTTRLGDLDIVQRLAGVPHWAALSRDAVTTTLDGTPLAVCSREHLIEMKRARGSRQDEADLEALAAAGLDETRGTAPDLEVPSRDEWERG
jgi:hypothetical protein